MDTYPALHLNSNHKSHPTTSQHQEITRNSSTNYETGQTGLKLSPGQSEILPLENTSQHEISKIHLILINFIYNEGKKLNPLGNRNKLGSLFKFLSQQKRFVSYYFPKLFFKVHQLFSKYQEFFFLNKRQRMLIKKLFFFTENNPQTRVKIFKLRHPWNIVFQNYNLEWPSTVSNIITPEIKCEGMDNCNKTTPYVDLELDNLTTLFTMDTGCSANILNTDTYRKVKHLEISKSNKQIMNLRNIQSQVSSIQGYTSIIPLKIGSKEYKTTFHIFDNNQFQNNYLGTNFLKQTKGKLDYGTQQLKINKVRIPLHFLNRDEALNKHHTLTFQEAVINPTSENEHGKLIDNIFSLTPTCFNMFGGEQQAKDRIKDILKTHSAGQTEDILEELDLNKIEENNRYPLETVDKYLTNKLYIPQKEDNTYPTNHWKRWSII